MFQTYANYCIKIDENVAFSSNDINESKVIDSLLAANVTTKYEMDQLIKFEYSKNFCDDGIVLSPGEAQKLNMARSFYHDSEIYIFDEPSASLDAKSEQDVFKSVFEHVRNKSIILISHRLSNLKCVERIMFIEDGSVIECGNHEELMKKQGEYYKLFNIQSSGYN